MQWNVDRTLNEVGISKSSYRRKQRILNFVENILCLKDLNTRPLPVFYQMIKNEINKKKQTKKKHAVFWEVPTGFNSWCPDAFCRCWSNQWTTAWRRWQAWIYENPIIFNPFQMHVNSFWIWFLSFKWNTANIL